MGFGLLNLLCPKLESQGLTQFLSVQKDNDIFRMHHFYPIGVEHLMALAYSSTL